MPNLDLSILVVDDAKFSSTVVANTLSKAGYRDIRIANDATTALTMLEKRKTSVLIADWLMPEMDGLELTQHVRQNDEHGNHFTYIILLTAKESPEALAQAFDEGVDDFIFKSEMSKQLIPRIFAGDRMADRQNSMLAANQLLLENNHYLKDKNIIDVETGVGNERCASESLSKLLKHTEARQGAASYMLIGISNWDKIKEKYNCMVCEEVAVGIARRLRNLIRPLDVLCRISENQYAVIAKFAHIDHCSLNVYRRILEGVKHKSFRTTSGYVSISAASSVCTIDNGAPIPSLQNIERDSQAQLIQAFETDLITISRWYTEAPATG